MIIASMRVTLFAPWVHSLKEKRMEIKSLIARVQNKFRISAAEVDEQDVHQILVIGIAAVAGNTAQGDSILDHVLRFLEESTQAEITAVEREVR